MTHSNGSGLLYKNNHLKTRNTKSISHFATFATFILIIMKTSLLKYRTNRTTSYCYDPDTDTPWTDVPQPAKTLSLKTISFALPSELLSKVYAMTMKLHREDLLKKLTHIVTGRSFMWLTLKADPRDPDVDLHSNTYSSDNGFPESEVISAVEDFEANYVVQPNKRQPVLLSMDYAFSCMNDNECRAYVLRYS